MPKTKKKKVPKKKERQQTDYQREREQLLQTGKKRCRRIVKANASYHVAWAVF